ncbi:MAG: B12-binding domain-containing radical SAM protein, partial [Chloroflexi bacterium]|nr:B12-binding domain-containing radical SAM protein [Chloroflexota bacterium]
YAASYMRARGYSVALFDAMLAQSEEEWARALDQHQPTYAVLFEDNFNYLSKMCLLRMRVAAFTMIAMAKARGCVVIVCGADATDHADEYLARGADYVLIGEGEATLGELLDALEGRTSQPLAEIAGLSFVHYPPSAVLRRPDLTNLDGLPFPAWDLVDVARYQKIWRARHGTFSMNMVTTRGCPYHCNWCAKPIWGQRYNSRSAENVVAELQWLKQTYQPDHIWFADDILGLKPRWLERFAQLATAQACAVPFKCLLRADLVKPPLVAALKQARCETVWMGAESGSQPILDAMDKGTTVGDIRNATRLLQAAGIRVGFFLQFGYPGETRADVELTLKLVRECLPDDIGISVSYPLPGTKFHERVKAELGDKQNWHDSSDLATLYRTPFPQAFYRTLHTTAHREFRMRRALRTLRTALQQPRTVRPMHLKRALSIPYHWAGWQMNRIMLHRIAH